MDDDECIHGLDPATCSICRAKEKAAAAGPPPSRPATRRSTAARPSAGTKPAAPARPNTSRLAGHLAGRKEFFGEAATGVWWLDQTGRAEEEWAEGVVTASRSLDGPVPAASRNVGEIRTGDVTLHVVDREVVAVGVATGDGHPTSSPAGWLAEVAVTPLPDPLPVEDIPRDLRPGPPHPFTNQGILQHGTCYPFPPDVARRLVRRLGAAVPADHPAAQL